MMDKERKDLLALIESLPYYNREAILNMFDGMEANHTEDAKSWLMCTNEMKQKIARLEKALEDRMEQLLESRAAMASIVVQLEKLVGEK
jgi:hypothetical protein